MKKNVLFGLIIALSAVLNAQNIDNAFFDKVKFRGAFGTTDWTTGWSNFDPQNANYASTTVTIEAGNITANTTWTKNNVYLLNGWVYVKDGATLTIEAGTVIRGDKTNKGSLIIEKGAKLIASGTATEPIVFTSNQIAGSRTYGDWGGIIICGKAPINVTGGTSTVEGGVGSTYGGTDAADNSGTLQYVRIEFPGIAFVANSEINGLTMGGVGSATTIDNVQVSYSGDDSFEWFGGTVNAKHLIALRGWDDDFDTDFGYSGMVQYAVSLRDPSVADQSKSNSFESDNDGSGTTNTPFTSAVFSNVSSFGPKATSTTTINSLFQSAMHLRRNTKLKIYNAVFAGWPSGLQVDGNNTQANATSGDLKVQFSALAGMTDNFKVPANQTWTSVTNTSDWYNTIAFKNVTLAENSELNVEEPFTLTAPKFTLKTGSALLEKSYWDGVSGIFTPKNALNKLTVYPNPATTTVVVELPVSNTVTTIDVIDVTGRTLIRKTVSSVENETFDVSELRNGIYMIVARNGEKTYSQKLTIN